MTKDLVIRPITEGYGYKIVYEKGGEVPDVLKGIYTKIAMAQAAIEAYTQAKGRTNGTAKAKQDAS